MFDLLYDSPTPTFPTKNQLGKREGPRSSSLVFAKETRLVVVLRCVGIFENPPATSTPVLHQCQFRTLFDIPGVLIRRPRSRSRAHFFPTDTRCEIQISGRGVRRCKSRIIASIGLNLRSTSSRSHQCVLANGTGSCDANGGGFD